MALVRDNIGPLNIFLRDKGLIRSDVPDVVMLQGFGTGPRCMRPVADHLRRYGHRCSVAPIGGLLGHLQTRSVSRAAKRLERYLASLPPGARPWIVGHSIGGIIARVAIQNGQAAKHPIEYLHGADCNLCKELVCVREQIGQANLNN